MDRATIEPPIKIIMTEIHSKLNEAARIAKAAEACALAGSVPAREGPRDARFEPGMASRVPRELPARREMASLR